MDQRFLHGYFTMGLQAMNYYGQTTTMVTRLLSELASGLQLCWHLLDERSAKQALEQIVAATRYSEQAPRSQERSKQKVAQAMRILLQVNEQLVTGAISAICASRQLEPVVNEL